MYNKPIPVFRAKTERNRLKLDENLVLEDPQKIHSIAHQ